ncbi:SIR2 family protein [Enterobacter mori]|uniref:SIR2 family protein n=1 Tax=Enterobacter mori TaxID=539813 RepID=UPI003D70211B
MKIFINHAHVDSDIARKVSEFLISNGHNVSISKYKRINLSGEDSKKVLVRQKNEGGFDAIITLITNNFFKSKSAVKELNNAIVGKVKLLIVAVDDITLPDYLNKFSHYRIKSDELDELSVLEVSIDEANREDIAAPALVEKNKAGNKIELIDKMRGALQSGNLTLMCGAGTSYDAGIPTWSKLLNNLFGEMIVALKEDDKDFPYDLEMVKESGVSDSVPALILAKYIKNNLKDRFSNSLRNALYKDNPKTCEVIKSIVELARPRRDGKSIDSIVTFNFDGLIEEGLQSESIAHKAIHSEAIKCTANEIAVYHVHGYLPREGKIESHNEIVFSEDGYHSQFIEPFSWSNIIQLQKLTQNICLFIGVSLTDPNMRRLLDVAWRKNPDSALSHFIIKRKPTIKSHDAQQFVMYLEEQDANQLGLNVIWVNEYHEIPKLLNSFLN